MVFVVRLLAPQFFFYSVFSARPARAPACSFFSISLVSLLAGARPGALSCFFLTLFAAELILAY
jgi:hypothetical protein